MQDKVYCCRYLLPISSPPLENAWIWTEGDKIKAFGSCQEMPSPPLPREDLGDRVVLPGFVNAHCHLELGQAEGLNYEGDFVHWIATLMQAKASWSEEDVQGGLLRAYTKLRQSGVVAIADHASPDAPLEKILALPLRGRLFIEILGASPALANALLERVRSAMSTLNIPRRWQVHPSPHSAHALAASVLEGFAFLGDFFSIHIGESQEERQCFEQREGPLAEFIARRGGDVSVLAKTPIEQLAQSGYLGKHLLLVHGNTITAKDLSALDPRLHSFVHCPGSHRYFNHPRFPLEEIEAAGFRVALGTDSCASNRAQDFLRELRLFQETYPFKSPAEIIRHATLVGVQTLGLEREIGSINVGKDASLIAFPYQGGDPYESVLHASQVSWRYECFTL